MKTKTIEDLYYEAGKLREKLAECLEWARQLEGELADIQVSQWDQEHAMQEVLNG